MQPYSIEVLERDIQRMIAELAALRRTKGHDYSGTADTLENLREFGSFGVLVRLGDKFKRLKHFYRQGDLAVAAEKITDTMDDLINYALYLKIMYRQEQEQSIPSATGSLCRAGGDRSLRCYLARAVRGPAGDQAPPGQVERNISRALEDARYLRSQIVGLELYCPHEHEDRYQQAWRRGLFTSSEVLHQCRAIVRLCDLVLVASDPAASNGVAREIAEAQECRIPILHLWRYERRQWPDLIIRHGRR